MNMNPKHVEKAIYLVVAIIFVFMMSACGATLEERYYLAATCQLNEEADCQGLWDDWNDGVEAQKRRDARRADPCGRGMVLYCDHYCMMARRSGEIAGECVQQQTIVLF